MKSLQPVRRGDTRLAVKAGAWYALSSFLGKGMAFITTPIFARLMSAEAYGEFSSLASWMVTMLMITSAELYTTINRAYYDYEDDFDAYVSTVMIAGCLTTGAVYVLFLLLKEPLLKWMALPEEYIHILFAALMLQSCKHCFLSRERTLYRYKAAAGLTLVNLLLPALISVVLVVASPDAAKLDARVYGHYVPSGLIGLVCAGMVLCRSCSFRPSMCRYAFGLSMPLMAHQLTAYVLTSSNTIVARSVLGAASAAVVSISSSTIHILTILLQSLSGAVNTWLMDNLKQKDYQKIRREAVIYAVALAGVSAAVILFAPEVVWILGGARYAEAVSLIPGQVMAVLIQSVTSIFTIILTYDRNVAKTAVCTALAAALSIAAKIVLARHYGIQVLPWINMAAFGCLYVINYLLVRKAGYGEAVDIRLITAILMAVGAVALTSGLFYRHTVIRYLVAAGLGAAVAAVLRRFGITLQSLLKSGKASVQH